jgi:hypothetical protein
MAPARWYRFAAQRAVDLLQQALERCAERQASSPGHPAWRLLRSAFGVACLLVGLVLLVLPLPGTPLVVLGLALLAAEQPRLLRALKARLGAYRKGGTAVS